MCGGQPLQISLNNGVSSSYTYDDPTSCSPSLHTCSLRLTQLVVSAGSSLLSQTYTYGLAGHLTGLVDARAGQTTETLNFTQDEFDRLTSVSGALSQTYAYDTVGDLTQLGNRIYTYGDPLHAHAVRSTSDGNTYSYDANGNMTARTELSGTQTVTFNQQWDIENQLTGITDQTNLRTWSERYDGDNQRVAQLRPSVAQVGPNALADGYLMGGLFEDNTTYVKDFTNTTGWTAGLGSWSITSGEYTQNLTTQSGAYAYHNQNGPGLTPINGATIFQWKMHFIASTSPAAGMYIFASTFNPTQASFNAYYVRQDATVLGVYLVQNGGTPTLLQYFPAPNAVGQTHSYQVIADPGSGRIQVWRDGTLLGTAVDAQHTRTGGAYVVLSTVLSKVGFDDVRVGQLTSYYTLGSQRVAERRANVLYYLHGDNLGSTSLVTCGSTSGCGGLGAVVAHNRYTPFGTTRWSSGSTPTDFTYTGARNSAGFVGLIQMGVRWFDAQLGRWASADSLVPDGQARLTPLTVASSPRCLGTAAYACGVCRSREVGFDSPGGLQ